MPSQHRPSHRLTRRQILIGSGAVLVACASPEIPADAARARDAGLPGEAGPGVDAASTEDAAALADASTVDATSSDASANDAAADDAATPPPTLDAIVSSASALTTTLRAWAADWAGTVPAGKSATDERTIGLDTAVVGNVDLSRLSFPARVCVRAVGTFHDDYTCSTYVQGTINMASSTNLWLCLMEVRAPDNGLFAAGLVNLDATTDCGVDRCSFSGWPFALTPGATGTTAYAISPNGPTNLTVRHNVYRYFGDGFAKWRGTTNNLRLEGNMGLYSGGDDYTVASGCVLNDALVLANYFDRHHAKAAGVHNDGWQQNGGSVNNRYTLRYNVGYRGTWTGTGETTSNGWQLIFTSGAATTSTGPWLAEHCIFMNGQQRAIDRIPGTGTLTVRYCAAVDSDVDATQIANARFPRILGADAVERNFVTSPNAGYTNGAGNGGLDIHLGGTPDHSLLLPYMTSVPTDTTDLWDIRPVAGSAYHPDYTPAASRVGPFDLWAKLLAGDPEVVLSRIGWPVAPLFIADFDHGDHFWGGYTGRFDANGNNA